MLKPTLSKESLKTLTAAYPIEYRIRVQEQDPMGTLVTCPIEPHDALFDLMETGMNERDEVRWHVFVAWGGQRAFNRSPGLFRSS